MSEDSAPQSYSSSLKEYFRTRSEQSLYQASLLSQQFVQQELGPEEIVALHVEALPVALSGLSYREQAHASVDGLQFLLEVMIAYGIQYREYLDLALKERTREARAAEDAQREKEELLAVIAHELRTPLTAASGSIDLATRSLESGNLDRVPILLNRSRIALRRLARMTADLSEASRGEVLDFELSPEHLDPILRQACNWATTAADEKGVAVYFEAPRDLITVQANADALLSVFGNLLSNAVRYTPEGGSVSIRQAVDGEWALVEVKDTGIGISPEVRDRIFERFFRAPEARSIEAQGLGLGLALVKQLVQAHSGRIDVKSVPGAGSSFVVRIPLSTVPVTSQEEIVDG